MSAKAVIPQVIENPSVDYQRCPFSARCESVGLIDRLILNHGRNGNVADVLLDARKCFSLIQLHPQQALESFFAIQSVLAKHDYMSMYRLRRLLAKKLFVSMSCDGKEWLQEPVDLRWTSYEKMLKAYRNRMFELYPRFLKRDQIELTFHCA